MFAVLSKWQPVSHSSRKIGSIKQAACSTHKSNCINVYHQDNLTLVCPSASCISPPKPNLPPKLWKRCVLKGIRYIIKLVTYTTLPPEQVKMVLLTVCRGEEYNDYSSSVPLIWSVLGFAWFYLLTAFCIISTKVSTLHRANVLILS